jgi:membrane-associated protease RseP (regulator of RpoE activity)
MIRRFLLCLFVVSLTVPIALGAQPADPHAAPSLNRTDENFDWSYGSDEGGSGSSYLGVDIADVSAERLGQLKLKEEHGAEVTEVDQDAPAGKAGLLEHDVIVSLNGTAVESAAQLRRMIKETPPGRVVSLGISRDGQAMTVKVQLADRHKSMAWQPEMPKMPKMPEMPTMPDFDLPVSVVMVHQLARSGLMVENITAQLGDFFGVKDGKGVLVRSVEKGSRGDKAGFRAGDVVIKVNNQPVHDTSDFSHAIRALSGGAATGGTTTGLTATVTVIREKREQNLTLTLPEKKDSGRLLEDSFDMPDFSAETQQAINRAAEEVARVTPAMVEKLQQQGLCAKDLEKRLQETQRELRDRQEKLRHELSGEWTAI